MRHFNIIGGGIGGLTTALALKQNGFSVRVFEQAPEFKAVGAGIILANNAMQIYEKLGLKEVLEGEGNAISSMKVSDERLNSISTVDLTSFEKKYGVKNTAIHRGRLQAILLSTLSPDEVLWNHRFVAVEKGKLIFEGGETYEAQTLIGADGIHSTLRRQYFPEVNTRDAKQICWRGIVAHELPEEYAHVLTEIWGPQKRFGFVRIDGERVYWYALLDASEKSFDFKRAFDDQAPLVKSLLAKTPIDIVHEAEIYDLEKLKRWHGEDFCLIGDAAHATTPNLGQGACQAIEDAWALAQALSEEDNNERAFKNFQSKREAKANDVVKTSFRIGKVSHWKNPIAVSLRNALMRLAPQSLTQKQSARIFEL